MNTRSPEAWSPAGNWTIRIDQTLTQDATGTMAYLQLDGDGRRAPADGTVRQLRGPTNRFRTAARTPTTRNTSRPVAAKYGILYSRAGNGICHQVHLERVRAPGKTLLGSDSHTPTAGGIGLPGHRRRRLDVAAAWRKGRSRWRRRASAGGTRR